MTAPDRCAHCLVPRDQHTEQRYATIPGWHDWKADRTETPRPVQDQINMHTPRPDPDPLIQPYPRSLYERWIRA